MSRKLVSVLCNVSGTLILLLVIALCLPMVLPKVLDYEVYHVVSGSMEPEIPVGSAVYVKEVPPEEMAQGDVAAFWSGGSVIVHRVVENQSVEGQFVTKGDANAGEDVRKTPYDALIGKVTHHVPLLGLVMSLLTSTVGKAYMLCFAACGAMFHLLAGRLRERGKGPGQENLRKYIKR